MGGTLCFLTFTPMQAIEGFKYLLALFCCRKSQIYNLSVGSTHTLMKGNSPTAVPTPFSSFPK